METQVSESQKKKALLSLFSGWGALAPFERQSAHLG